MREKTEDFSNLLSKTISDKAIGELMLAKNALEEKHEQIDKKEKSIRQLQKKNRKLEAELEKAREMLSVIKETQRNTESEEPHKGSDAVIRDIIYIISRYDHAFSSENGNTELRMLVENILELLVKEYGLEIIDDPADTVDPEIHQVIEVVTGDEDDAGIVRLARGYKVGDKILSPMKIKVIKAD
jgi:molecular chaperone GrpE (heat shock protein)